MRVPVGRFAAFLALIVTAQPLVSSLQTGAPRTPYAKVTSSAISELSGIVPSARHRGVYWVHNDSGDKARIFAIDAHGNSVGPAEGTEVANAGNRDWEDITREGNQLILSDMGNNGNKRRNLGVYVVPEPDPKASSTAPAQFIPIAYPDQSEFPPKGPYEWDCEALFPLRGKLYFITKNRLNPLFPGTSAKLYRLDTRGLNSDNVLKLVDRAELGGWVTSAAVSPNGKQLAVLTHLPQQAVWIFGTKAKDDKFLSSGRANKLALSGLKQAEAICWDDDKTFRIANEDGEIFRFAAKEAVRLR